MLQEQALNIDDVPPRQGVLLAAELTQMNEDDWVLLKKELQEYLYRSVEQTQNPAYENAGFMNWAVLYGDAFDRFYQKLRDTKPQLLLQWKKLALDAGEASDAEFIREWVAFRDAQ